MASNPTFKVYVVATSLPRRPTGLTLAISGTHISTRELARIKAEVRRGWRSWIAGLQLTADLAGDVPTWNTETICVNELHVKLTIGLVGYRAFLMGAEGVVQNDRLGESGELLANAKVGHAHFVAVLPDGAVCEE